MGRPLTCKQQKVDFTHHDEWSIFAVAALFSKVKQLMHDDVTARDTNIAKKNSDKSFWKASHSPFRGGNVFQIENFASNDVKINICYKYPSD